MNSYENIASIRFLYSQIQDLMKIRHGLEIRTSSSFLFEHLRPAVGRIKSIQQLDEENKSHVFAMLDAFLLKCNIQNNLSATK